jgi:hypothetical protein
LKRAEALAIVERKLRGGELAGALFASEVDPPLSTASASEVDRQVERNQPGRNKEGGWQRVRMVLA